MRVLVIGGGGREHALGWKIARSPLLAKLFFAPGNPGTASLGENLTLTTDQVPAFAIKHRIDLVVVGPEQPLVEGLADRLEALGVACFGPRAEAARLEGSKSFAKEIMAATGVPTARHAVFTDYPSALSYAETQAHPLVVKADGLAAGKGVIICHKLEETQAALAEIMSQRKFGEAGDRVVIEEFLDGSEASFHVITDGDRTLSLVTAKDHKAHGEGGVGPNTGGMGTYAPNPEISPELAETVRTEVCEPILKAMADRGVKYRGVLYAGLMLTSQGPRVLEFNVRFGDPETQVIMPLLDFDLLPVLAGAAKGRLPDGVFATKPGAAVCVVLAAHGYPGSARKGDAIGELPQSEDGQVFQAGTALNESGQLVTNGGRVLGATAWSDTLATARSRAYKLIDQVSFPGMYYRRDIGGIHD